MEPKTPNSLGKEPLAPTEKIIEPFNQEIHILSHPLQSNVLKTNPPAD